MQQPLQQYSNRYLLNDVPTDFKSPLQFVGYTDSYYDLLIRYASQQNHSHYRITMKNCFLLFLLASVAESFNVSPQTSIKRTATVAFNGSNQDGEVSRRTIVQSIMLSSLLPAIVAPQMAAARLEAVNRPDLLPSEKGLNVIQTEKFLTSGQAKRLDNMMANLEKETGFRLRVLCQNYPNTPGKLEVSA